MKRITSALLAASAALSVATAASATTVIDFSEYAFTGQGPYGLKTYSSLTSQGFEFTSSVNYLAILATNHYANTDPGGAVLSSPGSGVTRIRRLDGKAFSLQSFDFADFGNSGAPSTTFNFKYFDGVSEKTRQMRFDATKGLQTADLQLNNVQWFSVDTQAQYDNFRLGDAIAAPEPSAWALMIMGFGAAGAVVRRRTKAATA